MELVGIGVGPGDPDLLTVAAVRELSCAGRVFVPVMAPDVAGRAEVMMRAHLTHDRLQRLVFALNDDVDGPQRRRHDCWDAAACVVAHLREHRDAGALDRAWCAEHLGTPAERITPLAHTDGAAYLSMVVVLPPRTGRGAQL